MWRCTGHPVGCCCSSSWRAACRWGCRCSLQDGHGRQQASAKAGHVWPASGNNTTVHMCCEAMQQNRIVCSQPLRAASNCAVITGGRRCSNSTCTPGVHSSCSLLHSNSTPSALPKGSAPTRALTSHASAGPLPPLATDASCIQQRRQWCEARQAAGSQAAAALRRGL
jgi:hypothetical protein